MLAYLKCILCFLFCSFLFWEFMHRWVVFSSLKGYFWQLCFVELVIFILNFLVFIY